MLPASELEGTSLRPLRRATLDCPVQAQRASDSRLGTERMVSHRDLAEPTLKRQPFTRPGWIYELKYHGFRMLAAHRDGAASLITRRGDNLAGRSPSSRASSSIFRTWLSTVSLSSWMPTGTFSSTDSHGALVSRARSRSNAVRMSITLRTGYGCSTPPRRQASRGLSRRGRARHIDEGGPATGSRSRRRGRKGGGRIGMSGDPGLQSPAAIPVDCPAAAALPLALSRRRYSAPPGRCPSDRSVRRCPATAHRVRHLPRRDHREQPPAASVRNAASNR